MMPGAAQMGTAAQMASAAQMGTAAQMGSNQMPPPYGSQPGTPKMHHGQPQPTHQQNTPGGPQMYPGIVGNYPGGGGSGFGPNMAPQFNQQGNVTQVIFTNSKSINLILVISLGKIVVHVLAKKTPNANNCLLISMMEMKKKYSDIVFVNNEAINVNTPADLCC